MTTPALAPMAELLWPALYMVLASLALWQFAQAPDWVEALHFYIVGAGLLALGTWDFTVTVTDRKRR